VSRQMSGPQALVSGPSHSIDLILSWADVTSRGMQVCRGVLHAHGGSIIGETFRRVALRSLRRCLFDHRDHWRLPGEVQANSLDDL
jgi:hypothetical protein